MMTYDKLLAIHKASIKENRELWTQIENLDNIIFYLESYIKDILYFEDSRIVKQILRELNRLKKQYKYDKIEGK